MHSRPESCSPRWLVRSNAIANAEEATVRGGSCPRNRTRLSHEVIRFQWVGDQDERNFLMLFLQEGERLHSSPTRDGLGGQDHVISSVAQPLDEFRLVF